MSMVPEPSRVRAIEKREAKRIKTFLPTEILVENTAKRAHVLDISSAGSRLHTVVDLKPGAEVRLRLNGEALVGTVIWADAGRLGLRFPTLLAADQIAAVVGR